MGSEYRVSAMAAAKSFSRWGLTVGGVAEAAETAIKAAIEADPTARGAVFDYQGHSLRVSRDPNGSWQVVRLDGLGGYDHLVTLTRFPTSTGHAKSPALFTDLIFPKRG